MPAKAKMPAPIDRPLSRAYLRKFGGWSSAYPPGLSDPASLRIMENVLVNRDGSLRVRPGLRNLTVEDGSGNPLGGQQFIRGTHEAFYLNDGRKAYLFAVYQDATDNVQFRVAYEPTGAPAERRVTTLAGAGFTGPTPVFSANTTYVKYLQIDNKIIALSNAGEAAWVFYVGATKKTVRPQSLTGPSWNTQTSSGPRLFQPSFRWQASVSGEMQTQPPEQASGHLNESLISALPEKNTYNLGVFYTYGNDLGESVASDVNVVRTQRPFGGWRREGMTPTDPGTIASAPFGVPPMWQDQSGDTLIANIPAGALGGWDAAIAQGATHVNYYAFAWSDQDNVPVEAGLIGRKEIGPTLSHALHGYLLLNPWTTFIGPMVPVPSLTNRYNSSGGISAGQGLVAADRLILVKDPAASAVVKWTTNEMGNYLNFSPSRGGGYKTLTSGNMQIPACVKLWQNPQSADTITILNKGTDGYSTSYYMAPAAVQSQSDNTPIMGFEETTATPGTVSPYGCEVYNNALYHPLDDQLMKSTASNYNIGHRSQTDLIANRWRALANKDRIVSCVFDNRLYYLVHNPLGAALEAGCWGNELWILDGGSEGGGSWSRWLVQGQSLRKIEVAGREVLSLVRPDGIFWFDEHVAYDDVIDRSGFSSVLQQKSIPWRIETNTQGANRAHDAWAHLHQVQLTVGNLVGTLEFGIRGVDRHGQLVDKKKVLHQPTPWNPATGDPFDVNEPLLVQRDMMEWYTYAGSRVTEGEVENCSGQINLVQYRYTPVSVNVGAEFGSVETFEYGRDAAALTPSQSVNGVPQPFADTARP